VEPASHDPGGFAGSPGNPGTAHCTAQRTEKSTEKRTEEHTERRAGERGGRSAARHGRPAPIPPPLTVLAPFGAVILLGPSGGDRARGVRRPTPVVPAVVAAVLEGLLRAVMDEGGIVFSPFGRLRRRRPARAPRERVAEVAAPGPFGGRPGPPAGRRRMGAGAASPAVVARAKGRAEGRGGRADRSPVPGGRAQGAARPRRGARFPAGPARGPQAARQWRRWPMPSRRGDLYRSRTTSPGDLRMFTSPREHGGTDISRRRRAFRRRLRPHPDAPPGTRSRRRSICGPAVTGFTTPGALRGEAARGHRRPRGAAGLLAGRCGPPVGVDPPGGAVTPRRSPAGRRAVAGGGDAAAPARGPTASPPVRARGRPRRASWPRSAG